MLKHENPNLLETKTWPEAETRLKTERVVIVPIGAACKEHGLHLPLNTDYLLAEYLADQVSRRSGFLTLPTVNYGYYPAFVEYPGSINISQETFTATLCDIARSLRRHGSPKIYFLNFGISTNWALEPARQKLASESIIIEYTDLSTIVSDVESQISEQVRGTHADEIETSMMLYVAPNLVKMELAKRDDSIKKGSGTLTRNAASEVGIYSPTGAWGDPTLATVEKGKIVTEAIIDRIVKFLSEFAEDNYRIEPERKEYLI